MRRNDRLTISAGFECGKIGDHDLLWSTGHVPGELMPYHYQIAKRHGVFWARDGLPPDHDPYQRMVIARETHMDVVWDLDHYWHHPDPEMHAWKILLAHNNLHPDRVLKVTPINERALAPHYSGGFDSMPAVRVMMDRLNQAWVRLHGFTAEPVHDLNQPGVWDSTDEMAGVIQHCDFRTIGINYYPHFAVTPLSEVLTAAAKRYPQHNIMVTETSWHTEAVIAARSARGEDLFPTIHTKGDWLRHVRDEVLAMETGFDRFLGVCWYPFVDCPPWDQPLSDHRWHHGLIHKNLSVDPSLAEAMKQIARPHTAEGAPYVVGTKGIQG